MRHADQSKLSFAQAKAAGRQCHPIQMAIMRPAMCQVDGTSERGLLGRFHVEGFPTIFHVQGTETRPYTGKRTMQKVMLSKDAMHAIHELERHASQHNHTFLCTTCSNQ